MDRGREVVAAFSARPPITLAGRTAPFDFAPVVLGVWGIGVAVVLLAWALHWRRIREALAAASHMDLPAPAPVLSSPLLLEPGVVGVRRPVLLLPEGIVERLSPAELEAVIAHELCHIRRRDNLTATVHMLVQALFWFHPLVWWVGHRLLAERERACDEAVIRAGHARETYVRGILETCRHYLRSPLACVAGVSGSDLKKRVEVIMTAPLASPLSFAAKALFAAAAVLVLCSPVAAGVLAAKTNPQPQASPEGGASAAQAGLVIAQAAPSGPGAQPAGRTPLSTPAKPLPAAASPSADEIARLRVEQERPRQVVPFDPARFDHYVGYYEFAPNSVMQITRIGGRFFSQLTGQGPVELFPESDSKFFATVVAAQISFDADARGRASDLVLHQGGREQLAPRIDEAKARSLAQALEQRIASNAPSPGTAEFLKRYLDSMETGSPDYSGMAQPLAEVARRQSVSFAQLIKAWGPLKSVQFSGITPDGSDRYAVTFANAVVPTLVGPLDTGGKAGYLLFTQALPTASASAALAQRVKANEASPGTEASVRRWLDSIAAGQPDYADMAPGLAEAAREQWPETRQQFDAFGPFKAIRFVRVSPQGLDVYEADFQNNRIQVAVGPLNPDGKVEQRRWQVIP